MADLLDPSTLQTVFNFAAAYNGGRGVTPSYIYRLIRQGKLASRTVDGVVFVVLPQPHPQPPGAPGEGGR